jgi:hypothetical protein
MVLKHTETKNMNSEWEWAGKTMENDAGRLRYSAIHLWNKDDPGYRAACGANEPQGQWVAEMDSIGNTCKKCAKKEKTLTVYDPYDDEWDH